MKHLLPAIGIFLFPFFCSGCVYDDISGCPAYADFYCCYLSANKNTFYEEMREDMCMHFYQSSSHYRTEDVMAGSHDLRRPVHIQKSFAEGDLETVIWSCDDALDYDTVPGEKILEESTVRLKEITEGSGICRPATDLFYSRVAFTSVRKEDSRVDLDFTRPVCRIRVSLIPVTIQTREGGLPQQNDYTFRLYGTYGSLRYTDGATCGNPVVLSPDIKFDEQTGDIKTDWFCAFGSTSADTPEITNYLKVEVLRGSTVVATFDCAPLELSSEPGRYIDLVIDGKYVRPKMTVYVNSWRVAIVDCDL